MLKKILISCWVLRYLCRFPRSRGGPCFLALWANTFAHSQNKIIERGETWSRLTSFFDEENHLMYTVILQYISHCHCFVFKAESHGEKVSRQFGPAPTVVLIDVENWNLIRNQRPNVVPVTFEKCSCQKFLLNCSGSWKVKKEGWFSMYR